jgi:preprotein translocase subunit YajC
MLDHVLAGPSSGGGGSSFAPFLVLLALFLVAYFVFLRPARNRQRAAMQERRSVEVGDEVTTTAGLIATVVAIDDDYLTLEVAPGVHCRYVPAAILRVHRDDEEEAEPDEATDDETEPDVTNHEVIEDAGRDDSGTTDTPGKAD